MKAQLMFASLLTMGLLTGFVATVVLLAMYWGGMINAVGLIALTVLFNVAAWLLSPWIQDLILRWFYGAEVVEWWDFQQRWPRLAKDVEASCAKHRVPIPKMRIIDDGNPTAYCFGSGPWNSRLVATRGLFHYLDEDEVTAVYFHELGHIVNRDFVVMTIAATLLTVLYEMYVVFTRMRSRGSGRNPLPLIGLISYVFYLIGTYLVLYLSRTREYLADRFAAEETRNPNWLAMALVKVAYGITAAPDTEKSKRLMASTRALGLCDYKSASAAGSAYGEIAGGGGGVAVAEAPAAPASGSGLRGRIERVFLFDLFNPWAKVGEFNSTHPLTGKRIKKLMEYCPEFSLSPRFDFAMAEYEGRMLDRGRLYRNFVLELGMYFGPMLGLAAGLVTAFLVPSGPALVAPVLGLGIGWSLQGLYRFPGGAAERTTVLELMSDPYASPIRGRLVYLEGKLVGRVQAGSPIGEDMMLEDRGGGLISLNYESWLPWLGNLWFGWRKVANLMGEPASALGWFRRFTTAIVDLNQIKTPGQTLHSYTRFWGLYRGPVFILLALFLMGIVGRS